MLTPEGERAFVRDGGVLADREDEAQEFKPDGEFKLEAIYGDLAEHQRTEQWELKETVALFQECMVAFVLRFELDLRELAIRIDKLPKKTLGQYRRGHNGLGLRNEVTLSLDHVSRGETFDVLGTLLHELVHVWQDTHGRTSPARKNEHNAEFRAKCAEAGLIVDEGGHQGYSPDSPFFAMLAEFGVSVPECNGQPIIPDRPDRPGKSKHTRYECPCGFSANVTTTKGIFAHCDKCGGAFVPVERRQGKKRVM
jgi:SprT-like family